jgi:ADP-ribose pyrophosphatase YjhB (NUDIX family)
MDQIHVTVAAIIKRKAHYLLVKERSSQGHIVYNQPSGHVELNESLSDAIIREVKEEAGVDFTPENLIGAYLLSPASNGKTYLRFCFYGHIPDDQKASPQDSNIISNEWLTLDNIFEIPLTHLRSALILQSLRDYLNKKTLPLDCLHFSHQEKKMAQDCQQDYLNGRIHS